MTHPLVFRLLEALLVDLLKEQPEAASTVEVLCYPQRLSASCTLFPSHAHLELKCMFSILTADLAFFPA